MKLAQDEVFGPVLAVIPFKDEPQAIEMANDSKFGLAAGGVEPGYGACHFVLPIN